MFSKLWERVSDLKVHPLLVIAAWIICAFMFLKTGYLQAAWSAARGYKRSVTA